MEGTVAAATTRDDYLGGNRPDDLTEGLSMSSSPTKEDDMSTYDNAAHAYIAAWNTLDAAERKDAVAAVFAPEATYTDPLAAASGRDAIAELIGGVQQQFAGWTFRLAGPVDGHHSQARFTWALGPDGQDNDGEAPVVGFDVVTLDDVGLITSVLGFLDRVPTAA
jgi:SnoaL-like protein